MVEANFKYAHFRETQEAIYQRFRTSMATLGETATSAVAIAPQAGFLIALRHPDDITEQATGISSQMAALTPAITYDGSVLHTTVSDYGLAEGRHIDPTSTADKATLDLLCRVVSLGLKGIDFRNMQQRRIYFSSPLANETTVIAPGYGNDALLDINESIRSASMRAGINDGQGLRGAWGSHMTLNRFLRPMTPVEGRIVAHTLFAMPPIGDSVPNAVDVGYLSVSPKGFNFTTYERFALGHQSGDRVDG